MCSAEMEEGLELQWDVDSEVQHHAWDASVTARLFKGYGTHLLENTYGVIATTEYMRPPPATISPARHTRCGAADTAGTNVQFVPAVSVHMADVSMKYCAGFVGAGMG